MCNKIPSIAVLITCFNRKEKTLKCLESLALQSNMPQYDVFVCDDGSTDGTADAILARYPDVKIIPGSGNLFWTRGMEKAMAAAVEVGYDYYLMVNDDVEFFDTMWDTMSRKIGDKQCAGVTGCTKSKLDGKLTYSGAKFYHEDGSRYVGEKIEPAGDADVQCDVANWNCFLITCEVVEKIGLIDKVYEHSFGDFDYALRMKKAGIPLYVSGDYVGYCENNSIKNTYKDTSLSRRTRIKKILAPNGLPVRSWCTFAMRYYGKSALRNCIAPYAKFVISIIKNH